MRLPGITDQADQALHVWNSPTRTKSFHDRTSMRRRPLAIAGRERMLHGRFERSVLELPGCGSAMQLRLDVG